MKNRIAKASESAGVRKRQASALRVAAVERKVKQSFARQVAAFIKRYRPALEALAKR
ncbi:MAG: hypothetical protein ACREI3_09625 [Nitrospirales bacterium]